MKAYLGPREGTQSCLDLKKKKIKQQKLRLAKKKSLKKKKKGQNKIAHAVNNSPLYSMSSKSQI